MREYVPAVVIEQKEVAEHLLSKAVKFCSKHVLMTLVARKAQKHEAGSGSCEQSMEGGEHKRVSVFVDSKGAWEGRGGKKRWERVREEKGRKEKVR